MVAEDVPSFYHSLHRQRMLTESVGGAEGGGGGRWGRGVGEGGGGGGWGREVREGGGGGGGGGEKLVLNI